MAPTTATERDLQHLRRAIELADSARGHTSPNPLVGAVVVRGDQVLGEGFHARAGEPHAERMALADCGEDPAGATMYVSLEPCCHEGRTPPCTDAILEAGVGRVVVASDDPSEKASGRGLGILRDEGVQVALVDGEVAHEARLLNQPFRKHARTGRPLVMFKSAMSLDGKVATTSGDSQWISGEASRARAHRWRSECDAVAVGIGTARADDPLLTSRVEGAGRQPVRIVFDSEVALTTDSQLVRTAAEVPVLLVCSRAAKRTAADAVRNAGVEVIVTSGPNEAARAADALGPDRRPGPPVDPAGGRTTSGRGVPGRGARSTRRGSSSPLSSSGVANPVAPSRPRGPSAWPTPPGPRAPPWRASKTMSSITARLREW
ncbi:MAG: bifunctional diaminohydroxyphosphoribosylaminopyrimidine deaminase/5-amino-6-(5-phosphoribosylamino)uracil reductase RibD [Thermoleophilaceae bacterium]